MKISSMLKQGPWLRLEPEPMARRRCSREDTTEFEILERDDEDLKYAEALG